MSCHAAYAAAYFDAEGSVAFTNGHHGWSRSIQVVNTYRPTIQWLQRRYGGHVYHYSNRIHSLGRRPIYVWKIYRADEISSFITSVYPYIRQKTHHLEVMRLQLTGWISYKEAKRRTRRQ